MDPKEKFKESQKSLKKSINFILVYFWRQKSSIDKEYGDLRQIPHVAEQSFAAWDGKFLQNPDW